MIFLIWGCRGKSTENSLNPPADPRVVPIRFGSKRFSSIFQQSTIQIRPVRRFGRFAGSAGSPVQPVLKKVHFKKRCAPRFHAECTGHCVESFHEEPIREKNVIFKKVASWYPGIPVRGSASLLFSRFAGSHPFTGSPIRFASVFPVPGSRFPIQIRFRAMLLKF